MNKSTAFIHTYTHSWVVYNYIIKYKSLKSNSEIEWINGRMIIFWSDTYTMYKLFESPEIEKKVERNNHFLLHVDIYMLSFQIENEFAHV